MRLAAIHPTPPSPAQPSPAPRCLIWSHGVSATFWEAVNERTEWICLLKFSSKILEGACLSSFSSEWNQISCVHEWDVTAYIYVYFLRIAVNNCKRVTLYYITVHTGVRFTHNKRSLMCFGDFRLYSIFKIIPVTREAQQIFYMNNLFSQVRNADEECIEWRVLWLNPY